MELVAINPDHSEPGRLVTLTLSDMPAHATEDNTKVYLGGHLSTVDMVDAAAGTIMVIIGSDSRSGTFTVSVKGAGRSGNVPTTGYSTAEGSQLFTVILRGNETLISMRTLTPSTASVGDMVSINGQHLDAAERLRVGATFAIMTRKTEKQIQFRVPVGVIPGDHRISVSDATGEMHYSARSLEVVSKD